ncbi:unnamed protein product [Ambrosiozyma monospora]|uniref:Unnamed protein product n=1 Tax=Ambrosiozyma monospora TaxID=43982 RepID=A0A9W6YSJ7_AMBMO|nr:unnamed protein product [Ambrosiozyma monospora]
MMSVIPVDESKFHFINFGYSISLSHRPIPISRSFDTIYDNPGDLFLLKHVQFKDSHCHVSFSALDKDDDDEDDDEDDDDEDDDYYEQRTADSTNYYPIVEGWLTDEFHDEGLENAATFAIRPEAQFAFKNLNELVSLWLVTESANDNVDTQLFRQLGLSLDDTINGTELFERKMNKLKDELTNLKFDAEVRFDDENDTLEITKIYPLKCHCNKCCDDVITTRLRSMSC